MSFQFRTTCRRSPNALNLYIGRGKKDAGCPPDPALSLAVVSPHGFRIEVQKSSQAKAKGWPPNPGLSLAVDPLKSCADDTSIANNFLPVSVCLDCPEA